MKVIDYLAGIIFNPVKTLKGIVQNKPIYWALFIDIISSLLSTYVFFITWSEFALGNISLFISLLWSGISLFFLFFNSLLYFLIGKLLKGKADYWSIVSALGFTHFILLLSVLNTFILTVTRLTTFYYFLNLILCFWLVILYVLALRESHSFTTLKAILTLILSFLVIIVLIIFVVLFIALIMNLLI